MVKQWSLVIQLGICVFVLMAPSGAVGTHQITTTIHQTITARAILTPNIHKAKRNL